MSDHFPHPPDPYPLFAPEPRYRVSVCCMGDEPDSPDGWMTRFAYTRKWALRRALRKLYGEHWDKDTILVERRT